MRSLCWARNGDALLSASDDGTVRAWDMGSPGEPFWTFYANRSWCLSVRCAPDGTHFCTTGADREVKFWSLDTKEELSRVEGHEDQARRPRGEFGGGVAAVVGGRGGAAATALG